MKTLFSAIAAIAFSLTSVGAATIDLDRTLPAAATIASLAGTGATIA